MTIQPFLRQLRRPFSAPAGQAAVQSQTYAPAAPNPLNYKIFGENLPAVSIRLNPGESIYTQSAA
jgi:hypothetical protein